MLTRISRCLGGALPIVLFTGCTILPSGDGILEFVPIPRDCNFVATTSEQDCAIRTARAVCQSYEFSAAHPPVRFCKGKMCHPMNTGYPQPFTGYCGGQSLFAGSSPSDSQAWAWTGEPLGIPMASGQAHSAEISMATKLRKATAAVTITQYDLPAPGMQPGPITLAGSRLLFAAVASCRTPCDNSGVFSIDTSGKVARLEEVCSKAGPDCRITGLTATAGGGFCYNTTRMVIDSIAAPDLVTCVGATSRTAQNVSMMNGFLAGLTVGHDGMLWYVDGQFSGIGKIPLNDNTKMQAAYFEGTTNLGLAGITSGPDKAMWFTAGYGNKIGRIDGSGVRLMDIPTSDSRPIDIVLGPDGNLWFTEFKGNKIGRITPAGIITEFALPTPSAEPLGIAVGPDRALWFTESAANKIGRITVLGEISEYPIPTADSRPAGIVAGPDGNMWFTQFTGNKIGRITIPALPQVVEFYNTNLDNYFITANPDEQAAIDKGAAGPGWTRTGATFASGGGSSVCRFYGSITPGPNSHFYTADLNECAALKQLQATTPATQKRWNFESNDFQTTPAVNGACPAGLVPISRAYNNGFAKGIDSNHRITPKAADIADVVGKGWSNEGIVMCALQ